LTYAATIQAAADAEKERGKIFAGKPVSPLQLPAPASRVNSGPVQFGNDWPGIFLRGDVAMEYAGLLRSIVAGTVPALNPVTVHLIALLDSCRAEHAPKKEKL